MTLLLPARLYDHALFNESHRRQELKEPLFVGRMSCEEPDDPLLSGDVHLMLKP